MATATLTHHSIPGSLGEILIDVRAGSRNHAQPAVVLVHGFKGFKDFAFFPMVADRLVKEGFISVSISVSGSGVDEDGNFSRLDRFRRNTYSDELADLRSVLAALCLGRLGVVSPSSVGMLGHSRGGGTSLLLAAESNRISALATWNAIGRVKRHSDEQIAAWQRLGTIQIPHARLGIRLPLDFVVAKDCLAHECDSLDIPAAARSITIPWLQVHGLSDETVPFVEGSELAQMAGRTHELFPVDGAGHTFGSKHPWAGSNPALERVISRSISFFSDHLA